MTMLDKFDKYDKRFYLTSSAANDNRKVCLPDKFYLYLGVVARKLVYQPAQLYKLASIFTNITLASIFWDIGKQCRPRSDATERWMLTERSIKVLNKNEKYHPTALKTLMEWSN